MSAAKKSESRLDPLADPLLRDVPTIEGYKVLDQRYVLFETLGQGGMGVVYRGQHGALDIEVAVKCLDPGLVRRNGEFVARFEKEARAAARIQHQNVVRVYDVAEDQGLHYIVMEYVQGEDARKRIARKGALGPDESARLILGAARGLAAAHKIGLVHRDIKPDNILIGANGLVKVADLGLAKQIGGDSGLTYSGATMGTPRYMPPEQYGDAKSVGPAADVYSLGATLYFLLTGVDAIGGSSLLEVVEQVRTQPFPDPRAVQPDVPDALAELVAVCTQREPADRLQDAGAVAAAIEKSAFGRGTDLSDPKAGSLDTASMVSPPPAKTIARIRRSVSGVENEDEEDTEETEVPGAPLRGSVRTGPNSGPNSGAKSGAKSEAKSGAEATRASKTSTSGGQGKLIGIVVVAVLISAAIAWKVGVFGGAGGGPVANQAYTLGDWAEVVDVEPDPSLITDADGRDRMLATGLPWKVKDKDTGIVMLLVPPGEDLLGASPGDSDAYSEELPAHRVEFKQAFYLSEAEVTQAQWEARMGENPSSHLGSNRPVEGVSWDAISAPDTGFLALTGMRLPCDCEWEYACRASSDAPRYGALQEIAWFMRNSKDERHKAVGSGSKRNAWGFSDMLGNVAEWCSTARDEDLYKRAEAAGTTGPDFCDSAVGNQRIQRGGSWASDEAGVRASSSSQANPGWSDDRTGFRVAHRP
ncbi:MAG: serine/threonine protein kinase/formylglycine-generating enzyme required for sulfatase activity [Gammaproteobacteria bacterium]|jgi:serine/threonine protein kinase/formylglycine-generating enzyme required for sulfatase activity